MNSCERFELLASLAVDGEASPEELAELERHLKSCPECRAYYADISRIHQALGREDIQVPEGFAERLMQQVRATAQATLREERKQTAPSPRWRRWGALAACCALAAVCMWGVWGDNDTVSADSAPQMENMEDLELYSEGEPVLQAPRSADARSEEDKAAEPAAAALDDAGPQDAEDAPAEVKAVEGYDEMAGQIAPVPAPAVEPVQEIALPPKRDQRDETGAVEVLSTAGDELERDLDAAEVEEARLEPGIVTAFGSTAQSWVEDVLGLPWAGGGSYPLTAEQYEDLLRTLDEAGEPYRVEPGDCYGLLTE